MRTVHPKIARLPGLREAVAKHGIYAVARFLSEDGAHIVPQSFYGWRQIPAKRAKTLSRISGVPLHVMRPDLWEPPPPKPRAANRRDAA